MGTRYAELGLAPSIPAHWIGGGTQYVVQTPTGVDYIVYINGAADVVFRKSVNGGITWSTPTDVFAGTATALAVWYDRWSNISAGLIHLAYQESVGGDTFYRTINAESADALSTQTTIFAGTSTAAGGHLSITRARGGNVYCKTVIDAGAEGEFRRLLNANVPNGAWDAARTIDEVIATQDQMFLVPGFAADNQDIMAVFWDASADQLSRKIYDDSANTWAESAMTGTMTDTPAAQSFSHCNVAVDLTNSRIIVAAWSAVDLANSDLRCWTMTESAITETATNVVLNSTDDQGLCAVGIETDTGDWYVFYAGKSDGSETWETAVNIYYKASTDDGATWSAETLLTTQTWLVQWLACTPRFTKTYPWVAAFFHDGANGDDIWMIAQLPQASATYSVGV